MAWRDVSVLTDIRVDDVKYRLIRATTLSITNAEHVLMAAAQVKRIVLLLGATRHLREQEQDDQTVRATAPVSQGSMETCVSLLRVRAMPVNALETMVQNEPLETMKCVHSMGSADAKLVSPEVKQAMSV